MRRIAGDTTIELTDGRRGFRSKDTAIGQLGTVVTATYMNDLQEEVAGLVEAHGLNLDIATGRRTQLAEAIRRQRLTYYAPADHAAWSAGTIAGTATALVATTAVTHARPAIVAADLPGLMVRAKMPAASASGATFSIDGLPALPILVRGQPVVWGDWFSGDLVLLVCDGAAWNAIGAGGPIRSAVLLTVGPGQMFKNLIDAFLWLSLRRIAQDGHVIMSLTPGVHFYTTSVSVMHPDLQRVTIRGSAMTGAVPRVGAGLTVTGSTPAERASNMLANVTAMRALWPTELRFSASAGLSIIGSLGGLEDVLITSDGLGGSAPGNLVSFNSGGGTVRRLGISGAIHSGILVRSAVVAVIGEIVVSGCNGSGISVLDRGAIDAASRIDAVGNTQNGINVETGSLSSREQVWSHGNGGNGIFVVNGGNIVIATGSSAELNGVSGFVAGNGGQIIVPGAVTGRNIFDGIQTFGTGMVSASSGLVTGAANGRAAAFAGGGRIDVSHSNFAQQTTALPLQAWDGGYIVMTGCSGVTATTPIANTVGNANSYIKN
jgi:hypothetical protein